ncbi:MAG TPA: hypothetical protein VFE47_02385 [Tepidisphaeraceae bacterium]|jgi:hypothetical protein|nr:hypothetical protein [Tepidisphaeraceae bacterium]
MRRPLLTNSPSRPAGVKRLAQVLLCAALFLAAFIGGAWVAQSRNTKTAHAPVISLKDPAYGRMMPRVRLNRPTLREALAELARLSHADMSVDWDALKDENVDCDSRLHLDIDVRNVTLDQVLPTVLMATEVGTNSSADSAVWKSRIYIPARSAYSQLQPSLRIFDVRDVLAQIHETRRKFRNDENDETFEGFSRTRPDDADYLCNLITDTTASDSWMVNGGTVGLLSIADGRLAVLQTPQVQKEVAHLLDEIRKEPTMGETLPDPPPKDEWDNPDLSRKVGDLSLYNTPLHDVVDLLRKKSGANIFVNWADIKYFISRDDRIDLEVHKATLQQCADALVGKLNARAPAEHPCAWDMRRMLVIASRENLESGNFYPVVYPVDDLLTGAQKRGVPAAAAQADLLHRLAALMIARSSHGEKISLDSHARIWAGKLIVEQTTPQHRALRQCLAQLREGK